MAHFAQLDGQNVVTQVIVVHSNDLLDESGQENEFRGVSFCKSLFGDGTVWRQTSYNGNFRKNFAGVGFTYDPQRDAFIPPQPFASWVLNEDTCRWDAPAAYPQDGNPYVWDEQILLWVAVL